MEANVSHNGFSVDTMDAADRQASELWQEQAGAGHGAG